MSDITIYMLRYSALSRHDVEVGCIEKWPGQFTRYADDAVAAYERK